MKITEPEIFDLESLRKARTQLESEVMYREAAMQLEFQKAVNKVRFLQILVNGLKGTMEDTGPAMGTGESLKFIVSGFLRMFLSKYAASGILQAIIPILINRFFRKKRESFFDKIKSWFTRSR